MPHAIGPHTSFKDRPKSEEDTQDHSENDDEDACAGVFTLRGGCPGGRVEGRFERGKEGHCHIRHVHHRGGHVHAHGAGC